MRFYKREIYHLISISLFNLFFFGSVLFAFIAERLNLNELFTLAISLSMVAI